MAAKVGRVVELTSPPGGGTPAVFFAGNFLAGATRSMCEDLAAALATAGWRILRPPTRSGRLSRSLGMAASAWTARGLYDVGYVDLFSGPAFLRAEVVCEVMRLARKPYVVVMRGGNLPAFAAKHPSRVRRLLRNAPLVVSPSPYLQQVMRGFRSDIHLVANGIDLARYPFVERSQPRPRLVWLRAFHDIYDPVLAVDTLARVRHAFPEARLTMTGPDAGDGTLATARAAAARLDVAGAVDIELGVDKADVPRRLAAGDIFLNTARIDNLPVTVIEAMACGLCVVTTDVGGITYAFEHGRDALFVPSGDPDAMAAAVMRLLSDGALAGRLSASARATAERFALPAVIAEWRQVLAGLAGSAVR